MNSGTSIHRIIHTKTFSISMAVVSGCLLALSMPGYNRGWLAWFAIIPLLISLHEQKLIFSLVLGSLAGLTQGLMLNSWAVHSVPRYMGQSVIYGLLIHVVLACYFALWIGLFALSVFYFRELIKPWFGIILVPVLWVTSEFLHSLFIPGAPWTFFFVGLSQWSYPSLIQCAQFTGIFGVSFLVVCINYVLFTALLKKNIRFALFGIIIFVCIFVTGYLNINRDYTDAPGIKVAVLQENIPAEMKWTQNTTDFLVQHHILPLARMAAEHDPDLILWSESVIPWTISEDDDLIYKILNITWHTNAGHIIGMRAPVPGKPHRIFNSAFYIHPDGRITGQYNKMDPLLFVERAIFSSKTFRGYRLPFFMADAINEIEPGNHLSLPVTPYGKTGINICNEIIPPTMARLSTQKGANFIMVMSNDAWLIDTILPRAHFACIVFRAVENYRDIAVASNGGVSGFIAASGIIRHEIVSSKPECIIDTVQSRSRLTFYSQHGNMFSIVCVIIFLCSSLHTFSVRRKKGL